MGTAIFTGEPPAHIKEWILGQGPLCFTAKEDGANVSLVGWNNLVLRQCDIWCHLQYSTDRQSTWQTYSGQIVYLDSCVSKKVYFRADPDNPNTDGFSIYDEISEKATKYHKFIINKSVFASGNIQYLLTANGERVDVPKYCYCNMFDSCTTLTQAPALPATTLADDCYSGMFYSCRALINAPALPATTLAERCYRSMFSGCSSLTQAPKLPAMVLANGCYASMFVDCKSMVQAPELPATTLAKSCYYDMFYRCTSLAETPKLPATTLADNCYLNMFYRCTSLTQAPELPATTLANYCYYGMLLNCTDLTQTNTLSATTLTDYCYAYMFADCSALVQAPQLPATNLASNCYYNMFYRCSSLTQAPLLPATTLAERCYGSMFYLCESLTEAPSLPAMALAERCYSGMFYYCSSLALAPKLPASTLANQCYNSMFGNCSKFSECHMKIDMEGVYVPSTHGDTMKTVVYDLKIGDKFTMTDGTVVEFPYDETKTVVDFSKIEGKENIKKYDFSSSYTSIGNIYYRGPLHSIDLSRTSVKNIGSIDLFNCNVIQELILPSGLESFSFIRLDINAIKNFVVPDSAANGFGSLELTENLLTSITLPDNTTYIEDLDVADNRLTSLQLPSKLESYALLALYQNRMSSIVIPASMKQMGFMLVDQSCVVDMRAFSTADSIPNLVDDIKGWNGMILKKEHVRIKVLNAEMKTAFLAKGGWNSYAASLYII